jgi:hypothetical protein
MRPQRLFSKFVRTILSVAASSFMLLAQEPAVPSASPNEPSGTANRWRRVATDESQSAPVLNAARAPQNPATPAVAAAPAAPAPGQIVIPAGTWITVRVDQLLSSNFNQPGDAFGATLAQPIVADGYVVARRGQTITGRITDAIKAGRTKGTSRLGVEISELGLADGQQVPVRSQLVEFSAGTSRGNDTAVIGTTTGVGAAIGAAAAGGFGAGMGAIAGAGASAIGVLLSRGKATEVPPESIMKFRLMEPVTINTERAQHAFQPVRQTDFESQPLQRRVRQPMYAGGNWGWGGPMFYNPWMWGPSWGWGPGWGWGGGFGPRFTTVYVGGRGGGWGRGGGGRRR